MSAHSPHRIHSLFLRLSVFTICSTSKPIGQIFVHCLHPVHVSDLACNRNEGYPSLSFIFVPITIKGAIQQNVWQNVRVPSTKERITNNRIIPK